MIEKLFEWLENSYSFVLWALDNGWKNELVIDRIDNEKGYSPDNCRFVTITESNRNKRNSVTDWMKRTRKCRVCGLIKHFCDFAVSRKEVGGIAYECKFCRKMIDYGKYDKNFNKKTK